jgi:ABC-type multidrug transport system ATPase subunit
LTSQRTAILYDRIIVLEGGAIVEDGMPQELLEREGGAFRAMCLASGEYDQLCTMASAGFTVSPHTD